MIDAVVSPPLARDVVWTAAHARSVARRCQADTPDHLRVGGGVTDATTPRANDVTGMASGPGNDGKVGCGACDEGGEAPRASGSPTGTVDVVAEVRQVCDVAATLRQGNRPARPVRTIRPVVEEIDRRRGVVATTRRRQATRHRAS